MSRITIKFQSTKLDHKKPVVLVPVETWHKVEDLLEDIEAMQSKTLRHRVKTARQEFVLGKTIPFEQLP